MSGPTKKELQAEIDRLDQANLSLKAERSLMERKCGELERELERARSQNRSLIDQHNDAQNRISDLIGDVQTALPLVAGLMSMKKPRISDREFFWGDDA